MLWVGLTGGIGAGKSAASERLEAGGAALVDADRVARAVVEPGTPGLSAVVEAFGREVLTAEGALDREALGRRVFADDEARRRLNAVVHPLIGERTVEMAAEAERRGTRVLVHDVPLLVEGGLAPGYHLVVVVESPLDERLHRLTTLRGMPADDVRARMAAQAGDDERREVADVVLVNDGPLARLHEAVDLLLAERLLPYADNLLAGRVAERGPAEPVPHDPRWEQQGRRLVARLRSVCGDRAGSVEHVGPTAVPGLAAPDVLELEVTCPDRPAAEALATVLAAAGFPPSADEGRPPGRVAPAWVRRHANADPGRAVDVSVRLTDGAA